MQICLNILRAGLIASRVDLSVYKYPGVVAAPLVIGTIAGSGGKFLQDGIQLACGSLHGERHHLNLITLSHQHAVLLSPAMLTRTHTLLCYEKEMQLSVSGQPHHSAGAFGCTTCCLQRCHCTKEKKRKDCTYWRQSNEKPSMILGCPGCHYKLVLL